MVETKEDKELEGNGEDRGGEEGNSEILVRHCLGRVITNLFYRRPMHPAFIKSRHSRLHDFVTQKMHSKQVVKVI